MKLTLAEPRYFKDSIATVSELVTEARFQITKESITLVAMDPANVAMVVFKLFSSSFVEYQLDKDITISINLGHLKSVLKRIGTNDLVTLDVDEEKNKFIITISGKSKKTFSLPLLDNDEREQRIPNLQFDMKVTMPTQELQDAVEDMSVVSDSLSLLCDGNKLEVAATGDLTNANVEISPTDNITIDFTAQEPLKSRYSIEYLKKIASAGKVTGQATVQFAKDYPLRIEYFVKDRLQLAFVLAPRVENN